MKRREKELWRLHRCDKAKFLLSFKLIWRFVLVTYSQLRISLPMESRVACKISICTVQTSSGFHCILRIKEKRKSISFVEIAALTFILINKL